LTLQELENRKRVLVQETKVVKDYLEKQNEEIQECKIIYKKQKEKIKRGEKGIEDINEEALNYELLVRKVHPEIFDKNGELYKKLERENELLTTEATKGQTLYNAFESREKIIAKTRKPTVSKEFTKTEVIIPPKEPAMTFYSSELTIPKANKPHAPPIEQPKDSNLESKGLQNKEIKIEEENKTISKAMEDELKESSELKRSDEESKKSKDVFGDTLDEGFLSYDYSHTGSSNFPAFSQNFGQNSSSRLLSKGPTSENVITKRANLEGMLRLSNYGVTVDEKKEEDDEIEENIKDGTERNDN